MRLILVDFFWKFWKSNPNSKSKQPKLFVIYFQNDAICDISSEVKDELRKFRFRKNNANCALICKSNRIIWFCLWKIFIELIRLIDVSFSFFYVIRTVKVDREKQLVCVDEHLDEISVDELQEQLPSHQPRYIVYSE